MGNPYAPPGEGARPPGETGPTGLAPERASGTPGTGGPPAGPPTPRTPQGPPRGPAEVRAVRETGRRMMHFFLLLLAAVATSSLPLPWQAGALLFVLGAIVVGLRTLALAWRAKIRGGLIVALGAGVAMAGVVGLLMLTLLALWPQQMSRQRCLADAVTIAATQECEAAYQRSLDERVGGRTAVPES